MVQADNQGITLADNQGIALLGSNPRTLVRVFAPVGDTVGVYPRPG